MDIIVPSNYGGGLVWAQYAVSDTFRERIAGERLGGPDMHTLPTVQGSRSSTRKVR